MESIVSGVGKRRFRELVKGSEGSVSTGYPPLHRRRGSRWTALGSTLVNETVTPRPGSGQVWGWRPGGRGRGSIGTLVHRASCRLNRGRITVSDTPWATFDPNLRFLNSQTRSVAAWLHEFLVVQIHSGRDAPDFRIRRCRWHGVFLGHRRIRVRGFARTPAQGPANRDPHATIGR